MRMIIIFVDCVSKHAVKNCQRDNPKVEEKKEIKDFPDNCNWQVNDLTKFLDDSHILKDLSEIEHRDDKIADWQNNDVINVVC